MMNSSLMERDGIGTEDGSSWLSGADDCNHTFGTSGQLFGRDMDMDVTGIFLTPSLVVTHCTLVARPLSNTILWLQSRI